MSHVGREREIGKAHRKACWERERERERDQSDLLVTTAISLIGRSPHLGGGVCVLCERAERGGGVCARDERGGGSV